MRSCFIIILLLCVQVLFSQDFKVEVSDRKVGLNENFEISFILDDNGKKFSPPPFSDFQILRGPSKSTSTSIINGDLSQKLTYTYVLKAKKVGVFTILPASIKVNGKTIGTNPVTIQVQKGSNVKKPNSPQNIVSRKVHLNVRSSKNTCYVGEPIILTYRLYFNLNIGNLSPNAIKYTNFWADNLDVNTETRKRKYKGEEYNYVIVKQVVLTPQVSGKQVIDKFSIDLVANIPTGKRDFFNMMTTQSVNYTVVSNNLNLEVLDLPELDRPINFSGAIGDFSLVTDLDKDSVDINESAIFSIKISGNGNLNLINSPQVDFDSSIEVFDPKNVDKIKINQKGVQGYKKEEFVIVPRHKGTYNLKPVEFNFFNPKTKKYISLISQEKRIKVSGDQKGDDSYILESINKETIDLLNEDIKFIKTTYKMVFFKDNFSKTTLFYLLVLFPFIVLSVSLLYKKKYLSTSLFFSQNILKTTLQKLNSIKALLRLKKYEQFQSELLDILFFYVSKKFSIKKGDLSVQKIKEVFIDENIPKNLVSDYLELIKYLEKCKYSPHIGSDISNELYAKAVELINKIDVK